MKKSKSYLQPLARPQLSYGQECFNGNWNTHVHTRNINTTTTSRNRVTYFSYVTSGVVILSNDVRIWVSLNFAEWILFVCLSFWILTGGKIHCGKRRRCKCISRTTRKPRFSRNFPKAAIKHGSIFICPYWTALNDFYWREAENKRIWWF